MGKGDGKMRTMLLASLVILFALATACAEGGLAEPIPLPVLPEVTALPSITALPVATPLPTATESPAASLPGPATELPPATSLPAATGLPPETPLAGATPLPPLPELPTAEPAPVAPVLPTIAPDVPTPDMSQPLVTIGNTTWPVELAIKPEDRSQGLSGREELAEGAGMLFIFEGDQHLAFWMPDMNFPLDMVWIDSNCQVVDATLNAPVPEPGQSLADLPHFSPSSPARFVLEINAGEFEAAGLAPDDYAEFGGYIAGKYGC